MKFEDLDIKQEYDSRRNFVYGDFFNKILPNSNLYCRFGGVFSGQKFVQCAEGLQDFIKENDGRMELVLIPEFNDEDKDAFTEESKNKIITAKWKLELDKIEDTFKQDHIKALAWMIAHEKLVIKLILPQDEYGKPLTKNELKGNDILTEVGIFFNKDEPEDYLSFRGEIDLENGDIIRITTSRPWKENEKTRIDEDYLKFNSLWQENDTCIINGITCTVQSLNDELIEYFEEKSPETKEEIPLMIKLPELRDYQIDAVKKWDDNGGIGIFEMATGTGKTYTAIGCIKNLEKKHEKLVVIIAAPYTNLVDQWEKELNDWYIPTIKLEKGWTKQIRNEISSINELSGKHITVFLCSHAKFARDELLDEMKFCKVPTMLIVDEAHHVGSGNSIPDDDGVTSTGGSRRGLSKTLYRYRLGLSATIDRYFDDDGTDILIDYFKGTKGISKVKILDLEEAIKKEFLCQYDYHIYFIELTADERDEYQLLTHQAMKYIRSKDFATRRIGEKIIIQRSKIIRDAKQKMNLFVDIMKGITDVKHLLVFCSEKQYADLDEILSDSPSRLGYENPSYRKITYDNPKNKKDRIKILRDFADEDYKIILSNKVLDEGMDVPEAKKCIILASTGNPTQFIQRRGRVLRQFRDPYKDGTRKTHADIYDILVRPNIEGMNPDAVKLEIGIIRQQLKKITELSNLARNKDDCLKKIAEFKNNLPDISFEINNSSQKT